LHNANVTIYNRRVIELAMRRHAGFRKPITSWLKAAQTAEWASIIEARQTFPTADAIKGTNKTCFNIGGNRFRLIAVLSYELQKIVLDEVLTHAEYSKKYTS
jgi:mRNA interferase HigB